MTDPRRGKWALWSRSGEDHSRNPQPVRRLPASAELSGDGKWATVWKGDVATAVYIRMADGVRKGRRGGVVR